MSVHLPQGQYQTIVADPPWPYGDALPGNRRGAAKHYQLMGIPDVSRVPVVDWAAPNAHLYLWITASFLVEGVGASVCRAWGFEPKQIVVGANPQIGMGHWWRTNTEFLIFAVRGSAPPLRRDLPTIAVFNRLKHSEKPEDVLAQIEEISPGPRLEVFARRYRPGRDAVGNEVGVAL